MEANKIIELQDLVIKHLDNTEAIDAVKLIVRELILAKTRAQIQREYRHGR